MKKKFFVMGVCMALGAIYAEIQAQQPKANGYPFAIRTGSVTGVDQCRQAVQLLEVGTAGGFNFHPSLDRETVIEIYTAEMNRRPEGDWWTHPETGQLLSYPLDREEVAYILVNWATFEPAQWAKGDVQIGLIPASPNVSPWMERGPYSGEYVLSFNGIPLASCNCLNAIRVQYERIISREQSVRQGRPSSDIARTEVQQKEPVAVTVTVNNYISTPVASREPQTERRYYDDPREGCGDCGYNDFQIENRQYSSNIPQNNNGLIVISEDLNVYRGGQHIRSLATPSYASSPPQRYVRQQTSCGGCSMPTQAVYRDEPQYAEYRQYPPQQNNQQMSYEEMVWRERMERKMRRRGVAGQLALFTGAQVLGGFAGNFGNRLGNLAFGNWGAPVVRFTGMPGTGGNNGGGTGVDTWTGPHGGGIDGISYWDGAWAGGSGTGGVVSNGNNGLWSGGGSGGYLGGID